MLIDTSTNEEAFLALMMQTDVFGPELVTWLARPDNNILLQEMKKADKHTFNFDDRDFLPVIRSTESLVFLERDYKKNTLRTFVYIDNVFHIVLNPEYILDGTDKAVRYRTSWVTFEQEDRIKALTFFGGKLGTPS